LVDRPRRARAHRDVRLADGDCVSTDVELRSGVEYASSRTGGALVLRADSSRPDASSARSASCTPTPDAVASAAHVQTDVQAHTTRTRRERRALASRTNIHRSRNAYRSIRQRARPRGRHRRTLHASSHGAVRISASEREHSARDCHIDAADRRRNRQRLSVLLDVVGPGDCDHCHDVVNDEHHRHDEHHWHDELYPEHL